MKTDNNGKIIMGIAVMFVLAISIIGITYAYFSSQATGNNKEKSAEVIAGKLVATYSHGQVIDAQNVVPGWVSDGKHYYDPIYSLDTSDGVYKITAVTEDDSITACKDDGTSVTEGSPTKIGDCDNATTDPQKEYGISDPVQLTVKNASGNSGDNKYVLRIKTTVNGFGTTDKTNLKVTVKKSESGTEESSATLLWSGTLTSENTTPQIIVPEAETLQESNSTGITYWVYISYLNDENRSQNDSANAQYSSGGATLKATVDVIGVANRGQDIYDADGVKINTDNGSEYKDYTTDENLKVVAS